MSEIVQFSAGAHRMMATGSNLVDLDAERRARLRVELGTETRMIRSRKRKGRSPVDTVRVQPHPGHGRDGPEAA